MAFKTTKMRNINRTRNDTKVLVNILDDEENQFAMFLERLALKNRNSKPFEHIKIIFDQNEWKKTLKEETRLILQILRMAYNVMCY